jgi:predicted transcriptional regulator
MTQAEVRKGKSYMGKNLRTEILATIERNWPTHIKELIKDMGFEADNTNIKKFSYHVYELKKQEKVRVKKIGNAVVVWPVEMEKLRFIHELLRV